MTFIVTLLVLTIGGIVDAGYLYYHHRKENNSLVCPLDHDCSVVTESRYAQTFGIRNEILGLLYYSGLLIFVLAWLIFGLDLPVTLIILVGAIASLLFSLYLSAMQLLVIRDYCFYCLISAGISVLMFINSLYLYLNPQTI